MARVAGFARHQDSVSIAFTPQSRDHYSSEEVSIKIGSTWPEEHAVDSKVFRQIDPVDAANAAEISEIRC